MKMASLNHINLVVRDVDASAEFYEQLFGMERLWKVGDFVFLRCGESDIGLVAGQPQMHRRFHFGFRVDSQEEVDDWAAQVRHFGATVTHGPIDYGDYYTFTCRDPDGYGIEVYYEHEPRGRLGYPEYE